MEATDDDAAAGAEAAEEPPGEETEEPDLPLVGGRFRLEPGGPVPEGRGEVLHAVDEGLGRRVVLKKTDPGEARAYAKFNHPHIVTVHDVLTLDDGPRVGTWLVMEHAAKGSLKDRTMPPCEAARVGAQIADALTALHAKHLVHSDVKPANIVIAADDTAKLTDFDAAHRLGGVETVTAPRRVAYTPDYAAPEVAGGSPQPASDIFSLAATLYALVTGRPPRPWAHGGRERRGRDLDADRIVALRGIVEFDAGADLGPLRAVLPRMLAADPAERPDAARVRELLLAAAASRPPAWWRPPRRAALVGAAAALALAGALLVWQWPGGSGPPADSQPQPQPGSVIGDERTADPCALFDVRALSRFDDTILDEAYGNFDRCDVIVGPDSDATVDVMVDIDHDRFGEGVEPVRYEGEIGIVELEEEVDNCTLGLALPGRDRDTTIRIEAGYEGDEEGSAPLCEMAEVTAGHAARTLDAARAAGEEMPRRSFPADSLARQDACTLVDGEALAAVIPAVNLAKPDIGFGNFDCEWDSTSEDDLEAELRFDQGNPMDADDGLLTQVGGREALVMPEEEGDESCTVVVEHRSFIGRSGMEKEEMLRMSVMGSRPTDRLCTMATDLVATATAKLPLVRE
jgi:hypothetical protein